MKTRPIDDETPILPILDDNDDDDELLSIGVVETNSSAPTFERSENISTDVDIPDAEQLGRILINRRERNNETNFL